MKVDCQWIEENLEGVFCERLGAEEDRLARLHLDSCAACRLKVEELTKVDPVIKQIFRQNLAVARAPRVRRSPIWAGAFASALIAVIFVVVWRVPRARTPAPAAVESPAVIAEVERTPAAPVAKVSEPSQSERSKPEPDKASTADVRKAVPAISENAPAFVITDPAGYSRTLNDYRGYVLIFGVWSAREPKTVSNLERLYQIFGNNTKIRIVGVSMKREPRPKTATFPIAVNQASKLLGAGPSDVVIVDGAGRVRMKGTLLQEPSSLINAVQAALIQMQVIND